MIEEKQLLLKDLSARLPYGVKLMYEGWNSDGGCEFTTVETLVGIDDKFIYTIWDKTGEREKYSLSVLNWKPFLRSMSSMTEEEKSQYNFYLTRIEYAYDASLLIDWLNKNHFDFRGLIGKGLAIEAPELMYE